MTRFIALMGPEEYLAEARIQVPRRTGLHPVDVGSGILIAIDRGSDVYALAGGNGCVIGTLFHRHGPSDPIGDLEEADRQRIITTGGDHLVERFWGRYVALLRLAEGDMALRDPSGLMPCIHLIKGGILCLASEPLLLVDAGLLRPVIDDFGLARSLVLTGFPDEQTALGGVRYLRPGTAVVRRKAGAEIRVKWSPLAYLSESEGGADDERLRRAIQQSLSGWSRRYKRGLACISGGLDSSIVAAGLSHAGNDLSCLTLATDDPIGDERQQSRILAEYLGVPLFEERYSLRDIDLNRSSVRRQARPFGRVDSQSYDDVLVRTARKIHADAVFSGLGGDNVFFMSHSARPLADRFIANGFSAGLWSTSRDICQLTGESIFAVVRHAFGNWRGRRNSYSWRHSTDYISVDVIQQQLGRPAEHPWLPRNEHPLFPGKAAQIAMLLRMHHSLDSYAERAAIPIIHPLASQPVLECCLRIPTWRQCSGGVDRAMARRAFTAQLPPEIVQRRLKGSPQGFIHEIYRRFHPEIQTRLLDGYLVSSGIVARRSIEQTLAMNRDPQGVDVLRLLLFVDTEAWIKHWQSRYSVDVAEIF